MTGMNTNMDMGGMNMGAPDASSMSMKMDMGGMTGMNTNMDMGGMPGMNAKMDMGGMPGMNAKMDMGGMSGMNAKMDMGGMTGMNVKMDMGGMPGMDMGAPDASSMSMKMDMGDMPGMNAKIDMGGMPGMNTKMDMGGMNVKMNVPDASSMGLGNISTPSVPDVSAGNLNVKMSGFSKPSLPEAPSVPDVTGGKAKKGFGSLFSKKPSIPDSIPKASIPEVPSVNVSGLPDSVPEVPSVNVSGFADGVKAPSVPDVTGGKAKKGLGALFSKKPSIPDVSPSNIPSVPDANIKMNVPQMGGMNTPNVPQMGGMNIQMNAPQMGDMGMNSSSMGMSSPGISISFGQSQSDYMMASPMQPVQMTKGTQYGASSSIQYVQQQPEPDNPFFDIPDSDPKLTLCVNMTKAEYEAELQGASWSLSQLVENTTRAVQEFFRTNNKDAMGKEISKSLKGFTNKMTFGVLKMDPDNGRWFKLFFTFYDKFTDFCSGKEKKFTIEEDLRKMYREVKPYLVNVRVEYNNTVRIFKEAIQNPNQASSDVLLNRIGQQKMEHFGVNFALAMLGLRSIENVLQNM